MAPIIRPHEPRGFLTSTTLTRRPTGLITPSFARLRKPRALADVEVAFDEAVNAGEARYVDLVLADQLHRARLRNRLPILSAAIEAIIARAPFEFVLTEMT